MALSLFRHVYSMVSEWMPGRITGMINDWMPGWISRLINHLVPEDTDESMGIALAIVCSKSRNGKRCRSGLTQDGSKRLTRKDECVAAEARRNTVHILKDTLRKKEQLLMNPPELLVTRAKLHWMKRYTVLTEQRVKNLKTVLEKAKFKKNDSEESKDTYAYVYPHSMNITIYLCPQFWVAPKHLEKNSQMGTLIHEASHFLGTKDLAYGKGTKRIKFGSGGTVVRGILAKEDLMEVMSNADNIEYEFEVTLNHKGDYIRVNTARSFHHEYDCCQERAEHSVCIKAVNEDFFKYYKVKKRNSTDIKGYVTEVLKAADTLSKCLEKLQTMAAGMQPRKVPEHHAHAQGAIWYSLVALRTEEPIPATVASIVKLARRCLTNILHYLKEMEATLLEFQDYRGPEKGIFASALESLAREVDFHLKDTPWDCFICRENNLPPTLKRCTLPLASLIEVVKEFEREVLATEGLDMFDP
ncbi:uncharacterized protein [Ambystoma mexicanum]|uniref:uncharacterized protein n=1 Tax=Ambystoma mexicanum TaxID=8296 RepID=UPI0037E81C5B